MADASVMNRICAISLVILSALPFTAPFAAITLADFRGAAPLHACAVGPDLESHEGHAEEGLLASSVSAQRNDVARLLRPVTGELPGRISVSVSRSLPLSGFVPARSRYDVRTLATVLRV